MAYGDRSDKEVRDLESAIGGFEEEHGNNEFTEGALAVIKWMAQSSTGDVAMFMKEYDLTGE